MDETWFWDVSSVEVYARVLPAEGEEDAGLFLDCGVDVLQAREFPQREALRAE
jgi:hypothetical protein